MTSEQETPEELPTDRPFNPFREPRTEAARELVAEVISKLEKFELQQGLRQRRRRAVDQANFEAMVVALVCDLLHRYMTEPDGWLAVTLSKQVLGRTGRYGTPVLGNPLPVVLQHMASPEMTLVEMRKGHHHNIPGFGVRPTQTTIRAERSLQSLMYKHALELSDLRLSHSHEVIILKRAKAGYWDEADKVDYEDTDQTRQYRREMEDINAWLREADISISPFLARRGVDADDSHLRRYFTRQSFQLGGRLFGGFWQSLTKEERRNHLYINGERVEALDYGQMAPRILYGLAGAKPPEDDVYSLLGLESHRKGVKKVFNAVLFAEKRLTRFPRDTRALFRRSIKIGDVIERLENAHPAVKHLFFTGVGHQLQYVESEILVDVLLDMRERGLVGLPVHDAVLVPVSTVDQVREIMLDTFSAHTGIHGLVTIDT